MARCLQGGSQNRFEGVRAKIRGSRLSFGSSERLLNFLGVMPGSVSPFALINDDNVAVKVVLDKDMMEGSLLNFHPLTNEKQRLLNQAIY